MEKGIDIKKFNIFIFLLFIIHNISSLSTGLSVLPGTGRQYLASASKRVLIKRYHPRILPVQAPVLIASTAPVSGSTGTGLRPLLKSDWPV